MITIGTVAATTLGEIVESTALRLERVAPRDIAAGEERLRQALLSNAVLRRNDPARHCRRFPR